MHCLKCIPDKTLKSYESLGFVSDNFRISAVKGVCSKKKIEARIYNAFKKAILKVLKLMSYNTPYNQLNVLLNNYNLML